MVATVARIISDDGVDIKHEQLLHNGFLKPASVEQMLPVII